MRLPASRKYQVKLVALTASLLGLWGGGLATTACAEGINGFLEYGYSVNSSDVTSTTEGSSSTTGDSFRQRYYLNLDRTIYPNLRLNAGGLFEKTMNTTKTDDIEMDSESTRFTPRADLVLSNILYNAAIGYSRRIDSSETDGVAPPDNIIETMNGRFNFKPEGLPTLNLFYTRTNYFDENRTSRDTTTDAYSLSTTYKPLKDLDVGYLGQYTVQTDNLNNRESTSTNHNGRVAYSRQFLEGRASLSGTYNLSQQATENSRYAPLSVASTTTTLKDTSSPESVSKTSIFSATSMIPVDGVVIGKPNSLTSDYFYFILKQSNSNEKFDSIILTFNDDIVNIVNKFDYTIYKSIDAVDWEKVSIVSKVFSKDLSTLVPTNSLEIEIPLINTNYVIVVIKQAVTFTNIEFDKDISIKNITVFRKLFNNTSTESTSHLFNLGGRVRLYDPYDVNYEFFYTYSKSDTDFFSSSRYTISNALRTQHRFNSIVSGSARIAREDSSDAQQTRTAYLYSASLQATPLPLLSHSLVYSGRAESTGSRTSSTNSVYLTNSASPYRGVDLNLSAGYSTTTAESGQKTDSLSVGMGASLVPNTKLSINMNYAASNIKQSGGASSTPATTSHRGDLSLSYNPVRSIFLHASLGVFAETGRDTTTVQSFGGSWGILRDGSLQLNISYSENLNQANSQKDRSIVPSLRWNIRPGSHLDISYLISNSQTDTQNADFTSLSALLRIGF